MHAERLLQSICVPSLVSIAQVVFLLEPVQTHRQTDKQTDRQPQLKRPTHAGGYAGVGNKGLLKCYFTLWLKKQLIQPIYYTEQAKMKIE